VILNLDKTWVYKGKPSEVTTSTDCDLYIITNEDRVTGKKSTTVKKSLIISKDRKKGFAMLKKP